MIDLLELAERVEKAEGADQATLLHEAFVAIHGPKPVRFHGGSPELEAWLGLFNPFFHMIEAKAFESASLLLASGYGGQMTFFKDGTAKTLLWQPYPLAIEARAATPALATTAAALRARSAATS